MNIHDTIPYMTVGLPDDIRRHQQAGNFTEAIRLIGLRLAQTNLPDCLRNSLIAHREMFSRMPMEFPYTKEEALAIVQKKIPEYTMAELEEQMDLRNVHWIYLDGQIRIFGRFDETLFSVVDEVCNRVPKDPNAPPPFNYTDHAMAIMKEKGSMTNRIRVRHTLKLKDEHFVPGMFLRAHLPVAAACNQQSDIKVEFMSPAGGVVSPETSEQRTICWELNPQENPEFVVEYSYLHKEVYKDAYNGQGKPGTYDFDLEEQAPHIVFTPFIRALCAELTEGIEDPLMKARAFFNYITQRMKYTHVPEYFELETIPESCARNFNGDCGVFALLFITLCRCAGIPARWQSGMSANPKWVLCHDWVEFYVEPYGWMYVDASYGTTANRLGKEERRQFLFGNLDPYRMVANRKFQVNFDIPKEHWRADPYDNQTGEIETTDRGFRPDELIRTHVPVYCEEVTE
ncbi:MAG: transglutaminase-like domain-containing protein [Faecousia sp.]